MNPLPAPPRKRFTVAALSLTAGAGAILGLSLMTGGTGTGFANASTEQASAAHSVSGSLIVDESKPHGHDPATGKSIPLSARPGTNDPTHIDAAPAGVDVTKPVRTADLLARIKPAPTPQTAPPTAPDGPNSFAATYVPPGGPALTVLTTHVPPSCTGTGSDGNRVQAIYAAESGQTNRYAEVLPALQNELANIDDTFAVSAQKQSAGSRVRWVTDADCKPVVVNATVPSGTLANETIEPLVNALKAQGYTSTARRYLVFSDSTRICGVGQSWDDDSPGASNLNNGGRNTAFARVDAGCWLSVKGQSIAAHELLHTLGAVQASAPHSTPFGHCTEDFDLMCYVDAPGTTLTQVCPASQEPLLDCNSDDYFHAGTPAEGNYLASHWNTARSSFLDPAPVLGEGVNVTTTPAKATVTSGELFTVTANGAPAGSTYTWTVPTGCTIVGTASDSAVQGRCGFAVADRGSDFTVTVRAASGATAGTAQSTIGITKSAPPTVTVSVPSPNPKNGTPFAVPAVANGVAPFTYLWTSSDPTCPVTAATGADAQVLCADDGTTRTFTLTVKVTAADGQVVFGSRLLSVGPVETSQDPVSQGDLTAVITGPTLPAPGATLKYTVATNAADPLYAWSFDGSACTASNGFSDATLTLSCEPDASGSLTTSVQVTERLNNATIRTSLTATFVPAPVDPTTPPVTTPPVTTPPPTTPPVTTPPPTTPPVTTPPPTTPPVTPPVVPVAPLSLTVEGPDLIRPGLAFTFTANTNMGTVFLWDADNKGCLVGSLTARTVTVQCQTSATGMLTLGAATSTGDAKVVFASKVISLNPPPLTLNSAFTISASKVRNGTPVTLTAATWSGSELAVAARGTIALERSFNGRDFVRISAPTDVGADGRHVWKPTPGPTRTTYYRLQVLTGPAWNSTTRTVKVTSMAVTSITQTVKVGRPNVLTIRLYQDKTGYAGQRLRLQQRTSGASWVNTPTSFRTGSGGVFKVAAMPGRPMYYRWVFAGTATHLGSVSPAVRLSR